MSSARLFHDAILMMLGMAAVAVSVASLSSVVDYFIRPICMP